MKMPNVMEIMIRKMSLFYMGLAEIAVGSKQDHVAEVLSLVTNLVGLPLIMSSCSSLDERQRHKLWNKMYLRDLKIENMPAESYPGS